MNRLQRGVWCEQVPKERQPHHMIEVRVRQKNRKGLRSQQGLQTKYGRPCIKQNRRSIEKEAGRMARFAWVVTGSAQTVQLCHRSHVSYFPPEASEHHQKSNNPLPV